jgi:hypothetical protein
MWANYLRLVPPGGAPLRELAGPSGVPKLSGLQRWGYVTLRPPAGEGGPPRPGSWVVELTPFGRQAAAIWPDLPGLVEARWRERFGSHVVDALLSALTPLADPTVPRSPVVLGYGLFANTATPWPGPPPAAADLSLLLSQVLGRFAAELEATSPVSAALGIDVLRLLPDAGVAVGDLPRLGGISREAVATAVSWLTSSSFAEVATAGRVKSIALTSKGSAHQRAFADAVSTVIDDWQRSAVAALSGAVEPFLEGPTLVAEGLRPYEDGWRAGRPYRWQTDALLADPFGALPHHPMVLHRGGFPDGS